MLSVHILRSTWLLISFYFADSTFRKCLSENELFFAPISLLLLFFICSYPIAIIFIFIMFSSFLPKSKQNASNQNIIQYRKPIPKIVFLMFGGFAFRVNKLLSLLLQSLLSSLAYGETRVSRFRCN